MRGLRRRERRYREEARSACSVLRKQKPVSASKNPKTPWEVDTQVLKRSQTPYPDSL